MKYHQAISFNGFKLYTVKKKLIINNHRCKIQLPRLDGCKTQPLNIDQGYAEEYQALAWMLFVDDYATLQFIDSIVNKTINFKIKIDQVAFIQQDLFLLKNQLPYQVIFRVLRWEERSPNMSLINKINK